MVNMYDVDALEPRELDVEIALHNGYSWRTLSLRGRSYIVSPDVVGYPCGNTFDRATNWDNILPRYSTDYAIARTLQMPAGYTLYYTEDSNGISGYLLTNNAAYASVIGHDVYANQSSAYALLFARLWLKAKLGDVKKVEDRNVSD